MLNKDMEIRIRDLNIYSMYKNKKNSHILKNINLDIPKNRLTSIIGPSGCGKTTLLKSINRLHDIQENIKVEGHVFIGDEDIYNPRRQVNEIRKMVGLIAQRPYPLPANIYDNIAFGPRLHGKRKKANSMTLSKTVLREHIYGKK